MVEVALGVTLSALGVLAAVVPARRARLATIGAGSALVLAVIVDSTGQLGAGAAPLAAVVDHVRVLALGGDDPAARWLLLGAVLWCGPGADLVVRAVLQATGLPAPEEAAAAGLRAGRWVGRLERWLLLAVVAAGQPALAIIPTGGKALLRYAEAVADARAGRVRIALAGEDAPPPGRDAYLDYVLVGSLASWTQAVVLGLLVAGG